MSSAAIRFESLKQNVMWALTGLKTVVNVFTEQMVLRGLSGRNPINSNCVRIEDKVESEEGAKFKCSMVLDFYSDLSRTL